MLYGFKQALHQSVLAIYDLTGGARTDAFYDSLYEGGKKLAVLLSAENSVLPAIWVACACVSVGGAVYAFHLNKEGRL